MKDAKACRKGTKRVAGRCVPIGKQLYTVFATDSFAHLLGGLCAEL
jgi:hypothetical protein